MQQWKCYVIMGQTRDRLVEETLSARDKVGTEGGSGFTTRIPTNKDGSFPAQFPKRYPQKYIDRSRANGRQYYGHIGVLGDRAKGNIQQRKNYEFVSLIICLRSSYFVTPLILTSKFTDLFSLELLLAN